MRKKFLFTFIVEFRKGTYVSQVKSNTVLGAFKKWIDEVDPTDIQHLDKTTMNLIRADIEENGHDKPAKIQGMRNAWFTMLISKRGSFFINIVKTA